MIQFLFRFLGTNSRFIPAHSAKECIDSMVTIAKVCAGKTMYMNSKEDFLHSKAKSSFLEVLKQL